MMTKTLRALGGLLLLAVCSGYYSASTPSAGEAAFAADGLPVALSAEASAPAASAPTKRALLVGINTYNNQVSKAAEDRGSVRGWTNLAGPLNDVASMQALLTNRFGFDEENVHVLAEEEATNQGIKEAVRKYLIEPSAPGDQAFFFYAGHGSYVENSEAPEPDKRDETIVPFDAADAGDVRDKELRVLFHDLMEKGVDVTLIFDSCHSGSITRGEAGTDRDLAPSSIDVADARVYPPPPQDHPSGRAIVISAARHDEKAKEFKDEDGTAYGAFSWALNRVLRTAPPDLPAELMFQQARALMKARGFSQEPVLEGGELRRNQPLFGGTADGPSRYTGTVVPALEVLPDGRVVLEGGLALGLRERTELRRLPAADESAADTVRIRIERTDGLTRSEAVVVEGDASRIGGGDLFLVDRWAADPQAPLQVWLPSATLEQEDVEAAAAALDPLRSAEGITWIEDPTRTPPTHIVAWNGSAWELRGPGEAVEVLGETPDAATVQDLLTDAEEAALYVTLPPFRELGDQIQTVLNDPNRTNRNVKVTDDFEAANYRLNGYSDGGMLKYFWVLSQATDGAARPTAPPTTQGVPSADPEMTSRILAAQVDRLNRTWGWLHLETPPAGTGAFPYRLAGFEDVTTGEDVAPSDTLRWRRRYRVKLEAPKDMLDQAVADAYAGGPEMWYVYVFVIDRGGNGALLFPATGGNETNRVNLVEPGIADQTTLALPEDGYLFESVATNRELRPETDTFFLLATANPLPDPSSVLNFMGVGTRGKGGKAESDSPLSSLLFGVGDGTRGVNAPVPTNWFITRSPVVSSR